MLKNFMIFISPNNFDKTWEKETQNKSQRSRKQGKQFYAFNFLKLAFICGKN